MPAQPVRATLRDDAGHTHDVVTTASHPFWVVGEDAFVDIVDIPVGAALLGSDGGAVTIVGKAWQYADVPVYNFEVEGQHNYFAAGVLGHNGGRCFDCNQQALVALVREAMQRGQTLSISAAEALLEWGVEYALPGTRAGISDVTGAHWLGPHIHAAGEHIPVEPGVRPLPNSSCK